MTVKRNIVANLSGSAWAALMSIAFVPLYIKFMGVESFGIIGVYTALVGILAILDLGLSQTMNREMARLSSMQGQEQLLADTARTLEVVYWFIAIVVMSLIYLLSDFIVFYWLNPEQLSRESLQQAFWIMALVIGLRWPIAIYTGGLNGLQRQVKVNMVLAIFTTLQGIGALVVLWLIEPTIQAFFLWQAFIALLHVIVLRITLWRSLSHDNKGKFCKQVLHNVWRFAAGMTGISLLATILTQLDKVLLSRMLSLADFGYYTFAATVAMVVFRIVGPVFTAYYPRLTELVAKKDQPELIKSFHQGSQLMAVAILPLTLILAFFSKEVLDVWTHNPEIVAHSSWLISLLIIGNAINGIVHIPYALQLGHGWTKLAFYQNTIAVILLVPAIYFATLRWGAVGAASVWIVLNCGYFFISVQVMFRRLIPEEKWRWYVDDVGKILLAVMLVTCIARAFAVDDFKDLTKILILVFTFGTASALAAVSANKLAWQFPFLPRNETR